MTFAVRAAEKIVKGAVKIVKDVVKTVEKVVKSALDDPIATIAKVAAYATGNAWAIPLIDGASVAAKGGDIGDVLRATAISYGTGKLASAVGTPVGKAAGQYAAQQGASAATQKLVSDVLKGAVGRSAVAIITKQDPVQAFITGGVMAATPAVLGKIDGFSDQPEWVRNTISTTVGATIASGGNLTERDVASIVAASGIVSNALKQFDPDGTKLSPAQHRIAADALLRTTSAALVGGDPGQALTQSLTNSALKALGEFAKEEIKAAANSASEWYAKVSGSGDQLDSIASSANDATNQYNSVADSLRGAIAEQDRLQAVMDDAINRHNNAEDNRYLDEANAAIEAYEAYVTSINTAYNEYYKPELDRLSNELTSLDEQYKELTGVLQQDQGKLQAEINRLTSQLDPIYATTYRSFAETLLPDFDVEAYRALNPDMPDDVDPYLHYITDGQFQGLRATKDQLSESQSILDSILGNENVDDRALQAYIDSGFLNAKFVEKSSGRAFEDLMSELNARITTEDEAQQFFRDAFGRDAQTESDRLLIESYIGKKEADAQSILAPARAATEQSNARRNETLKNARDTLEEILRSEGYRDEDIAALYDQGVYDQLVEGLIQEQDRNIQALQNRANAMAAAFGADSPEARSALTDLLQAKNDVGGYGVTKEGDDFIVTGGLGSRDDPASHPGLIVRSDGSVSELLQPREVAIDGLFTYDDGTTYSFGEAGDQAIVSALAIGESPNPPADGGRSLFGTGSGSGRGPDFGFSFLGIDQKTGGAVFDSEDSGFSLITYSDGKALAVDKKDPTNIIWVSPDVAKEVVQSSQVKTPEQIMAEFEAAEREKANNQFVSADEVRKKLEELGYKDPSDEVIASFTGGTPNQSQVLQSIDRYVDENTVTQDEARAFLESLGVKNPTQADVDRFVGQYLQTDLESRVQPYIPDIKYNAIGSQISGLEGAFDARVKELMGQGQNEFQASQNSLKDLNNIIGLPGGEGDAPTGLYGDIAGLPSDLGDRIGGLGTSLEGALSGLGGRVEDARNRQIQVARGRTEHLLNQARSQLPSIAQNALTTYTPLYGEMDYIDLGAPLQISPGKRHSMFDPARQNQVGPVKMSTGGFLDDQGGPDTWDDILRMLGN
jgi:hypothetical protein